MSKPVGELFGANLARCRAAADVTQEDLAFQADLHRTEIGLLERGGRIPRIDTLVKLAGIEWTPGRISRGGFDVKKAEPRPSGGDPARTSPAVSP